jgi:integrase
VGRHRLAVEPIARSPRLREGRFYDTKSKHSRRIVELPSPLIHSLKVWRLKCPKGEHDLVFPNNEDNPMDAANLIHRGFEPAVRRAGLRKIRFHDLRHAAASLLLANGIDVVAVSRLLGHSSPIVTLSIYSHAIPKARAPASRIVLQTFLVAKR